MVAGLAGVTEEEVVQRLLLVRHHSFEFLTQACGPLEVLAVLVPALKSATF